MKIISAESKNQKTDKPTQDNKVTAISISPDKKYKKPNNQTKISQALHNALFTSKTRQQTQCQRKTALQNKTKH